MKQIQKNFSTLTKAEKYLEKLYSKYNHVRVISTPLFSESGVYVYEVGGEL